MSKRMLVTCPESAHLEEIELEEHTLGSLLVACTAFCPNATEISCPGTCASRLDRKRFRRADPTEKVGATLLLRSCLRSD